MRLYKIEITILTFGLGPDWNQHPELLTNLLKSGWRIEGEFMKANGYHAMVLRRKKWFWQNG